MTHLQETSTGFMVLVFGYWIVCHDTAAAAAVKAADYISNNNHNTYYKTQVL